MTQVSTCYCAHMANRRRRYWIPAALVALGILTACGSSGTEDTATGSQDLAINEVEQVPSTDAEEVAVPTEETAPAPEEETSVDSQEISEEAPASSGVFPERLEAETVVGPFAISMPADWSVEVDENPNWDIVQTTYTSTGGGARLRLVADDQTEHFAAEDIGAAATNCTELAALRLLVETGAILEPTDQSEPFDFAGLIAVDALVGETRVRCAWGADQMNFEFLAEGLSDADWAAWLDSFSSHHG